VCCRRYRTGPSRAGPSRADPHRRPAVSARVTGAAVLACAWTTGPSRSPAAGAVRRWPPCPARRTGAPLAALRAGWPGVLPRAGWPRGLVRALAARRPVLRAGGRWPVRSPGAGRPHDAAAGPACPRRCPAPHRGVAPHRGRRQAWVSSGPRDGCPVVRGGAGGPATRRVRQAARTARARCQEAVAGRSWPVAVRRAARRPPPPRRPPRDAAGAGTRRGPASRRSP
jgi:hypothetical protein